MRDKHSVVWPAAALTLLLLTGAASVRAEGTGDCRRMEGIRTAAEVERCIKTKHELEVWKRLWIDTSSVEFFYGSEREVVARIVIGVRRILSAPFERLEPLGYSEPQGLGRLLSVRHHGREVYPVLDRRAAWNLARALIPAAQETIEADEQAFQERLARAPELMSFWDLEALESEAARLEVRRADLQAVRDFVGALNKVEERYREIFLREHRPPVSSSGLSRLEGIAAGTPWER